MFFPDSSWIPQYGWNKIFDDHDIVVLQNTYGYLRSIKKSHDFAQKYAHMQVMKMKYPHLQYNNADEHILKINNRSNHLVTS